MRHLNHSQSFARRRDDDRYYYTRHQYLAAYLVAHGLALVNVDRDSHGLLIFVFRDTPEREELVQEFRYGPEALVDARTFVPALIDIQRLVEQVHPDDQDTP